MLETRQASNIPASEVKHIYIYRMSFPLITPSLSEPQTITLMKTGLQKGEV